MWMCPKCGCVEVVIYAENIGERCVVPRCTGTREVAKSWYNEKGSRWPYDLNYNQALIIGDKLCIKSKGGTLNVEPDIPEIEVPTEDGETQVPDPNKTNAPWVCMAANDEFVTCAKVRLLWRVPNTKDWCANPRCTGERAEAVEAAEAVRAYGDNLEKYKAKFAAAVDAVRRVVRHNKPLATGLAEKRRGASFIGFMVPEVPRLVKECVDELMRRVLDEAVPERETTFPQGLFRVPGNDFNIKALLRAYQENQPVVLEKEAPNDIAGLLKRFFMQLQTPLLGSKHEKLEDLAELSDGHKLVLRYILPLLRAIANTKESQLDAKTLATSIACIAEKTDTQKTQEKAALARSGQPVYSDSLDAITQEAAAIKRRLSFIARVISESADVDAILNGTTIRKPAS
jgi:hypothetical protein